MELKQLKDQLEADAKEPVKSDEEIAREAEAIAIEEARLEAKEEIEEFNRARKAMEDAANAAALLAQEERDRLTEEQRRKESEAFLKDLEEKHLKSLSKQAKIPDFLEFINKPTVSHDELVVMFKQFLEFYLK